MEDQILGLLRDLSERTRRLEQWKSAVLDVIVAQDSKVDELNVALSSRVDDLNVATDSRYNECRELKDCMKKVNKEIRELRLRLALAVDDDATYAAPYSIAKLVTADHLCKVAGFELLESCNVSALGAVHRFKCFSCQQYTYVCPEVQDDSEKRDSCLKLQGWTLCESCSESVPQSTAMWKCPQCSTVAGVPRWQPASPLVCCENHDSTWGRLQTCSLPRNTVCG